MPVFSKRHGYDPPKEIAFREELPTKLRTKILEIVGRYVSDATLSEALRRILDPYGMDEPPTQAALAMQTATQNVILLADGVAPVSGPRALLLTCPWFRVYDVIEEVLRQLAFYETELLTDPEEELRVGPLQRDLNDYFVYAGIGWQFVDDKVVARGDEAFEVAVKTAAAELRKDGRTTAAGQIHEALQALSRRPSGAYGGGAYDILGPTGSSLGYPTVAAKAGDSVELFGVGFGPTTPAVPAGQAFSGAAPTKNTVQLAVGGTTVTPSFAGLSLAGLYQLNVTIPAGLGTGDQALVGIVGDVQTQSGVVISLQ